MQVDKPTMHCQQELERDLNYQGYLPDELLLKWSRDLYSTSNHLLTLYSIIKGLGAKNILEIGFGRSSFVLIKAVAETGGKLLGCDMRDFSYLLNKREKEITTFLCGSSDQIWQKLDNSGFDFAFLDYFSSENILKSFIISEISKCLNCMKTNGVIAIHDSTVKKYAVGDALQNLKKKNGFFHNRDLEILSLPYNYGLGLIRKIGPSSYGSLKDNFKKKSE